MVIPSAVSRPFLPVSAPGEVPNSELGNEVERRCREPSVVGRVTPCPPRLQPSPAIFPRRHIFNPLPIRTFPMLPRPSLGVRRYSKTTVQIAGLKGRHMAAQGNALGSCTMKIKRCKRATILLLTPRHSNVVAQVSKPACRGFSAMYSSRFALFFSWGSPRRLPDHHEYSGQAFTAAQLLHFEFFAHFCG